MCRQVNGRNGWDRGLSCANRNPVPAPGTSPSQVGSSHVIAAAGSPDRPRGYQRGWRPPDSDDVRPSGWRCQTSWTGASDPLDGGVRPAGRGRQTRWTGTADPPNGAGKMGPTLFTCIGRRPLFCQRVVSSRLSYSILWKVLRYHRRSPHGALN